MQVLQAPGEFDGTRGQDTMKRYRNIYVYMFMYIDIL